MTFEQGLAFGLVGLTIVAFIWGRFRYDLVAVAALLAGMVIGVIPPEAAFDGFRNDIVIIIAAALVVSAAFARSGLIEWALQGALPLLKTERTQVPVLTLVVTLLSMISKNVGALAIMLPVAMQVTRNTGTPPSRLLMPMAAGAMAGGMVTLVGTSPNIIVAQVREGMTGAPFSMFDYAPVGLGLTAVILAFLAFGYRLLPRDRQGTASLSASLEKNAYSIEMRVPEPWAPERMTISALNARAGPDVRILRIVRDGRSMASPRGNVVVRSSDLIVAEGSAKALGSFLRSAQLILRAEDSPVVRDQKNEDVSLVEAVINLGSPLIDRPGAAAEVHARFGVNLLGVSRSGRSVTAQVERARLKQGDIILMQGSEGRLSQAMRDLELLPLAERHLTLGEAPRRFLPAIILGAAMALVGFQLVPVAAAFFGAAVLIVMLGGLTMREAYRSLDGPLLVLVAALIPVSEAIQATGGDDLIASMLSGVFGAMPGLLAITALMFVSMAVTPFLNNAATVLIVAPIGATLALQLGYRPDPFLMAVAVGAACDFLTPIGHQCNTLVMRPAGYRFEDYPRLGAPLSLLVMLVGPPLILLFWPL